MRREFTGPVGVLFVLVAIVGGVALADPPQFTDETNPAGINVMFSATGYSHWDYTGGGAVGDFDRDGWQDLFVLSGGSGGAPDSLYINNGNGTFTDQAATWGLTDVHLGKGAGVGDFNGDGWLDIYVTSAGTPGSSAACQHRLYRNDAGSGFTNVATAAGVDCTSASESGFGSSFGDYDLDGDLDLFVAGFGNNNLGNRIFRNNGDSTFTDITADIGFFDGTPISISGFSPRFADMDGDFYPELLLASDFGTSRYFRNDTDGTFTDLTGPGGTGEDENGMGQAVADFNGDLLLDWYVTSIYLPQVDWTGNKLYLNQEHHVYDEVAEAAGCFNGGYGWGAVSVDFNHDGFVDIGETNGGGGSFGDDPSKLWINSALGTYTEMAQTAGLVHTGQGRGMLNFDYDNDGDQDVVIFGNGEFARLYRNDISGTSAGWFRVFLDTSAVSGLAPNGFGSRILITHGGVTQLRYMTSGDNFLSHSELSAHFGLGTDNLIDMLEVWWPNGETTTLSEIAADQTLTMMADGPVTCSPAPDEIENLRVDAVSGGTELHFTWDELVAADSYRVLSDSQASGGFELVMGDAASGLTGLTRPTPPGMKFFLVAGRRDDCQGPK